MIKAMSVDIDNRTNEATVSLFADEKSEVPDDMSSVEVKGLPKGVTIAMGSKVTTADADLAYRKSNNKWNWI